MLTSSFWGKLHSVAEDFQQGIAETASFFMLENQLNSKVPYLILMKHIFHVFPLNADVVFCAFARSLSGSFKLRKPHFLAIYKCWNVFRYFLHSLFTHFIRIFCGKVTEARNWLLKTIAETVNWIAIASTRTPMAFARYPMKRCTKDRTAFLEESTPRNTR